MTPTPPASAPLPKKCLHCGGNTVRPRRRPGRTIEYKTIAALPLPADLMIPTCSRCRTECLDAETAQQLEGILSALYLDELRRRAGEAIRALRRHISQRRLELWIGLSQGYLSRLLTDAGTPSPALVLLLAQLAQDPASRLPEVERFWGAIPNPQDLRDPPQRARTKVGK
jgi:hypothetical protein